MVDTTPRVTVDGDTVSVVLPLGAARVFQRAQLPETFLRWQAEARLRMFQAIRERGAGSVSANPVHLPVLATLGEGPFPINLATRGMGLLPRPELIERFTALFLEARVRAEGRPPAETLADRVAVAAAFYERVEHFDQWLVGGLEIFEGETAHNLQRHPLASLLYTGGPPRFESYQFNGAVEMLTAANPCSGFLLAARELFALDSFHVPQSRYAFGYLFHVVGGRDKRPYTRDWD